MPFVDGAQLLQQQQTVADRFLGWRFDERKLGHITQFQIQHAQDHIGQRRSQNLRIGKLASRLEILFVIQTDTDAISNTAATAGTLACRRPGDLFDLQLFDLAAIRVPLNAGQPRIHDVANARHSQRCFRHIRRQHNAPAAMTAENPILLLSRETRIQRQNFGVRRMMLTQHFSRFADLTLPRQKHQYIAGALPLPYSGQFVDRVADGFVQPIFIGLAFFACSTFATV